MCVCIDDSSTSVSHVSNETINLVGHVSFNVGNIGTGKVYLCFTVHVSETTNQ